MSVVRIEKTWVDERIWRQEPVQSESFTSTSVLIGAETPPLPHPSQTRRARPRVREHFGLSLSQVRLQARSSWVKRTKAFRGKPKVVACVSKSDYGYDAKNIVSPSSPLLELNHHRLARTNLEFQHSFVRHDGPRSRCPLELLGKSVLGVSPCHSAPGEILVHGRRSTR